MLSPQTFATHLARAVDLFRDPDAKALQKTELRALMGLLSIAPVSLKTDGGSLVINGTVVEGVIYRSLVERLSLHNVREITLPSDAPPGDIFNLLKTLADQPTSDNVPTRLRSTGTQRVTVEIARLFSEVDNQEGQKPDPGKPAPKIELGVDGILQGNMEDMPMPEPRKSTEVLSRAVMPPPGALDAPPIQRYSDAMPRPEDGPPVPFSGSGRPSSIDASLSDLAENPTSPAVSAILASLGEQVDAAVRAGRFEQAAKILAGIVRQEQLIPDTGPRRQYGIALKRMYSRPLLDGLVQLLDAPGHEADASLALQRGGTEAVDILLEQLVASTTVSERRHAFDALSKMREAAGQIIHMMGHAQWYVVRNMAELVGELGLEDAVPALVKQLDHEDERVRKAVALALAKIGTKSVVEPLRRALRDSSADVRMQAAIGVGGRKANALAMPLVVALEEEKNPDVIRELVLGLGRIGSPDAVQALIKLAQPAGRFIGRKPTGLRLAAVESLRLAATPAALGALQGLATDSDRQVKIAAVAAVAELKR